MINMFANTPEVIVLMQACILWGTIHIDYQYDNQGTHNGDFYPHNSQCDFITKWDNTELYRLSLLKLLYRYQTRQTDFP